jgi:hypothetical protein
LKFFRKDPKEIIKFMPIGSNDFYADNHPTPSIGHVPQWYKNIKRNYDPSQREIERNWRVKYLPQGTVKKCIPVLDAFGVGYIYSTPMEIMFDGSTGVFVNFPDTELVQFHEPAQIEGWGATDEYIPVAYKWRNFNIIKTPPGWSCLFTHPLNRTDLPFYTLSGVVDTDKHPAPIHFPFLMKKGFTGKIDLGTPVVQIIPFKRADWSSEKLPFKPTDSAILEASKYIEDNYKKSFWQKKNYG